MAKTHMRLDDAWLTQTLGSGMYITCMESHRDG